MLLLQDSFSLFVCECVLRKFILKIRGGRMLLLIIVSRRPKYVALAYWI